MGLNGAPTFLLLLDKTTENWSNSYSSDKLLGFGLLATGGRVGALGTLAVVNPFEASEGKKIKGFHGS